MKSFDITGPDTVDGLVRDLGEVTGTVAFLSGGTDLIIELNQGTIRPDLVVDLSQVEELNHITKEQDRIRIGAATPFTWIAESGLIQNHAQCLAQAACQVGSVQIRNRGTIGGNLATASPAGDSIPALFALGARITTAGPQGSRQMPVEALFPKSGGTCLMEKEFITEIDFPVPGPAVVSAFEKIGSRTAVTIAKLNLAGVVDYDAGQNRINRACLAVGCLGRTVFRLDTVETCLNGRAVDEDLARETAGLLARAVDQAIPGRYSQGYKRTAVQGMGLDLLAGLFPGRLKGGDHDRK